MRVGLLNICTDGQKNLDVDTMCAKINATGSSVEWQLDVNKFAYDGAYKMCHTTPDCVVLTGAVKSFLQWLKNRFNQSFVEDDFEFDGVKYFVVQDINNGFDNVLQSITPKVAVKIVKFGVFGKTIDQLRVILSDLIANKSKIKFEFLPQNEIDCVAVVIKVPNKAEDIVLEDILKKISDRLSNSIYGWGQYSIMEQVAALLKKHKIKIAVAESYTAGAIASLLCSVEGASQYFIEGIVGYSEQSKISRLGVDRGLIAQQGTVNEDVVYEMAAGLLVSNPNCDLVIATTGFASKKVINNTDVTGQCYLAIGSRDGIGVFSQNLIGDRQQIAQRGAASAIFKLYKLLMDREKQS